MAGYDFAAHVRDHNRRETAKAVGFALAAAVFWVVCWWLLFGVMYLIQVGTELEPAAGRTAILAWVGVGLLGVEVVRFARTRASWGEELEQSVAESQGDPEDQLIAAVGGGRGMIGILLWHLLLCAPRCTAGAWLAWRSRADAASAPVEQAESLFHQLARTRDWVSMDRFAAEDQPALATLQRLGLLWVQERQGLMQARVPPSITLRYFGEDG